MSESKALPTTLLEAVRYFSDVDVATDFVAQLRWPDGPICPECGGVEYSYLKTRRLWKCKKQYSVKLGTIFEDSALALDKWLPAVWLIANSKNGISSHELGRAVGTTRSRLGSCCIAPGSPCRRGASTSSTGKWKSTRPTSAARRRNMHADVRKRKIPARVR